jgi:hypothetical protein
MWESYLLTDPKYYNTWMIEEQLQFSVYLFTRQLSTAFEQIVSYI